MADFTPAWSDWTDTRPFRFWAQKVLPLAYDDSLSYYEVLCKLVVYLNTTIANVAALGGNVDNLRDAYEQLQQYVNDYFTSLDVQQEINTKLDNMAETGALTTLIEPFVNAQISSNVAAWLELNIKPTTPAIDASLTVQGAAADAKKVGDEITNVNRQISDETTGLDSKAPVIVETASGAIASFNDGADDMPVRGLFVAIEPVQAGSGDPSPDNVRPITGWTGAEISHSGADTSSPETYNITFPAEAGTVYGGSLDVTTGVLTVDRAIHIVTAEELQLVGTTAKGIQYLQPKGGTLADAKTDGQKASNMYITKTSLDNGTWRVLNGRYYIYDNRFSDLETAKAIVTETEIQLVYELATPITYTLTPQEVRTLLGINNIWSDTGDTEVTYLADTKLYIDNKIATLNI